MFCKWFTIPSSDNADVQRVLEEAIEYLQTVVDPQIEKIRQNAQTECAAKRSMVPDNRGMCYSGVPGLTWTRFKQAWVVRLKYNNRNVLQRCFSPTANDPSSIELACLNAERYKRDVVEPEIARLRATTR